VFIGPLGVPSSNEPNNTSEFSLSVPVQTLPTDLRVQKDDTEDPLRPGDTLTYNNLVANEGSADAFNVVLSDVVPPNTTFLRARNTEGSGFNTMTAPQPGGTGTITFSANTLATLGSARFEIIVRVNDNVPLGSTITNTATVTSSTPDTNTSNNSDTETTLIQIVTDLGVNKFDGP